VLATIPSAAMVEPAFPTYPAVAGITAAKLGQNFTSHDDLFNFGYSQDRYPGHYKHLYDHRRPRVPVPIGPDFDDYFLVDSISDTHFTAAFFLGVCNLPWQLKVRLLLPR
jgi:hypothetical protein